MPSCANPRGVLRRCLRFVGSALVATALLSCSGAEGGRTILNQDVEALLDEQVVVEHDEAEREREHIVAGPDFEELANPALFDVLARSSRRRLCCMAARNPASQPRVCRRPQRHRDHKVARGPAGCLGMGMLTRPCICSLSRALGDLSDIVRLGTFGRRYDDGATKGSS